MSAEQIPLTGVNGQFMFCYLVFGKEQLPRNLVIDYWTNPHATLVARSHGVERYCEHILDVKHAGMWPQPWGVETDFPSGWRPDGVVEATISDTEGFTTSPVIDLILTDEQNFLRRGLPYLTKQDRQLCFRDELLPPTSGLKRPETRVIVLFRRREETSEQDLTDFLEKDLAEVMSSAKDIIEDKAFIFSTFFERLWPSVVVEHEQQPEQQYHGLIMLTGRNRIAVESVFRSEAFRKTLPSQSELFSVLRNAVVANSVFLIEVCKPQLPGLRGVAIAQILSRVGATSQAEEPVLSQVLSRPDHHWQTDDGRG